MTTRRLRFAVVTSTGPSVLISSPEVGGGPMGGQRADAGREHAQEDGSLRRRRRSRQRRHARRQTDEHSSSTGPVPGVAVAPGGDELLHREKAVLVQRPPAQLG